MHRVPTGHTETGFYFSFFFPFKKLREAEASSVTVGKHAPSKELLELALTAQQLKLFPDLSPYCLLKIWLP